MASSSYRVRRRPERPYVICHMVASVDGRIVTDAWHLPRGLLMTPHAFEISRELYGFHPSRSPS